MRHFVWVSLLLAGCPTGGGGTDGPTGTPDVEDCTDGVDNDGDGDADCADSDCASEASCIETDCDDATDNDGDGATDCDDSDCTAEVFCSWPRSLDLDLETAYSPSSLAELAGYNACAASITSPLARDRATDCTDCDRVFCGDYTYVADTCPNDPHNPKPTDGCFGFVFQTDPNADQPIGGTWNLWLKQEGAWSQVGTVVGDGSGAYTNVTVQNIQVDNVDGGDVTITTTFTE